jgi:carboxyl-terminal processing protease
MKSKFVMRLSLRVSMLALLLSSCGAMSSSAEQKVDVPKKIELPKDGEPKSQKLAPAIEEAPAPEQPTKLDVLRDVLFPQIYSVIKQYYVEEPDQELMIQGAINGMLSALDPHSSYMGPKEYKDFREHTQGSMLGVGIQIVPDRGAIRVIAPIEDTPAYRADIKSGDYIIKVDGEYVFGLSIDEAIRKLRGVKAGTEVTVSISRNGEMIEKTMRREEIKINSVKWGTFQDIGYIRISTYDEACAKDFIAAVTTIKRNLGNKLKGIIIDVRFNPGGLLNTCVDICNNILDEGVVVSSKGRDESQNMVFKVEPTGLTKGIPLVVLIDEGSASASEILAAAVQDHKRGLVIGTQSYGKGTVQVVVPFGGKKNIPEGDAFAPLREERAIRLTISRYYTSSGRSIQGKGVLPDLVVEPAKIEKLQRQESLRESDFKNALDVSETERRKNNFFNSEKKKSEKDAARKPMSVKKQLDQDRLNEMYDEDYQFLRAVDTVKTLSLVQVPSKK